LAAITGLLSIRQVDWTVLLDTLAHLSLPLLILGFATVLTTMSAKAVRWRVLLRPCNVQASGWRILRVTYIGQMLDAFVPRLGDVGRAVLIGPQSSGGVAAALGTILVEKALDGCMGLLLLVGLALWTPLPPWLRGAVLGLALLAAALLMLLVLAAARPGWALRLFRRLTAWLPPAARTRARQLLADFGEGLAILRQPRNTLLALAWSVAIWGVAAFTNVVTLAVLDIDAPIWSAGLVLAVGYAAAFLPTVPGQVGVFEYASVLALGAVGVDPTQALAFGLVLHILVHLPPAILGPICMAIVGLNFTSLRQARQQDREHDSVAS
jgi:uncharacterized protein (TIRG00374 family)